MTYGRECLRPNTFVVAPPPKNVLIPTRIPPTRQFLCIFRITGEITAAFLVARGEFPQCRVEWNPSARLNCSSTGFVVSRVVSFENLSDVDTARNFDRSKRWISHSFVREINARCDGIRQDQQFVRTDSYETLIYFDTLYMRDSGRKLWWQMTKCLVWKNRFKKDKLKRDIRRDNIKIKKFSA